MIDKSINRSKEYLDMRKDEDEEPKEEDEFQQHIDALITEPELFYGEDLECPICKLKFKGDPETFFHHMRDTEGISYSQMLFPEKLKSMKKDVAKELANIGISKSYKGNTSCIFCVNVIKNSDYYEHLISRHLKEIVEMNKDRLVEENAAEVVKEQDKFAEGLIDEVKSIMNVKAVCSIDSEVFKDINELVEHNKNVHNRDLYDVLDDVWKSIESDGDDYEKALDYVESNLRKFNPGSASYEYICPKCNVIHVRPYELADHILDKHIDFFENEIE